MTKLAVDLHWFYMGWAFKDTSITSDKEVNLYNTFCGHVMQELQNLEKNIIFGPVSAHWFSGSASGLTVLTFNQVLCSHVVVGSL